MSRAITTRLEAAISLAESVAWYNGRAPGLGNDLLDELKANYVMIKDYPQGFRETAAGIRQCPLKRFPYVILYHVEALEILVLAVFHTSRDLNKKGTVDA